jgi:3-oxoacyl-[acyl-carrier protein] reductase
METIDLVSSTVKGKRRKMPTTQLKQEAVGVKRLEGKVALVTGGSRGIGAAIALKLAEQGAKVAISYQKSKGPAEAIVERIGELGTEGLAVQANAASQQESNALVDAVVKKFGRIDILVNNAGVFEGAPVAEITLEHYERVYDVNIKGVLANTVAALKVMPEGGRIINISSGAARMSMAGASVYSSTKAALDTLTRIWAQELGARKITVNGVAPGTTETDMYHAAVPDEAKTVMVERTALGRIGTPDDIAGVVLFLASDDGRWVTGHTIAADGGISI